MKTTDILQKEGLLEFTLKIVSFDYNEAASIGQRLEEEGYQVIKDNTRYVKATGKKEAHFITDLAIKVEDVDAFVSIDD